jgi:hypothetical protein
VSGSTSTPTAPFLWPLPETTCTIAKCECGCGHADDCPGREENSAIHGTQTDEPSS